MQEFEFIRKTAENTFFVAHSQKETTIFDRRLSFLFVLFSFRSSLFSQIVVSREKIREKVALLCNLKYAYGV